MSTVMQKIINRKKNGEIVETYVVPGLNDFDIADKYPHDTVEFEAFKKIVLKLADNIGYNIEKYIKKRDIRGSFKAKIYKGKYGNKKPFPEHSINIIMGSLFEKAAKKYVKTKAKNLTNYISIVNNDGTTKRIQVDSLFLYNNIAHGFELKANVNLDTGKARDTVKTIKTIGEYLSKNYKDYEYGVVSLSAPTRKTVPDLECGQAIKDNKYLLYGYQEFFAIFGVFFREKEWDTLVFKAYEIIEGAYNYHIAGKSQLWSNTYE